MARVTIEEVKTILGETSLTDAAINAAINAANVLVTKISLGCASGLSEYELTQIELYLSAHLCTNSDPTLSTSEVKFENASKKYNIGNLGSGVLGTPFGQTANMLSNGCLQELTKRKPNIVTLGVSS